MFKNLLVLILPALFIVMFVILARMSIDYASAVLECVTTSVTATCSS